MSDNTIPIPNDPVSATSSGFAPAAFVAAGIVLFSILLFRGKSSNQPPPPRLASTQPVTLAAYNSEGAILYNQYCFVCHGIDGRGDGPAAGVLDPRPRDFRIGKYRIITSSNGVPFREDLIRTIRNGMPGTSMPSWHYLSNHEIETLADYIYSFSINTIREQLTAKKLKPAVLESILKSKTTPTQKIVIPPEPAVSAVELQKGQVLFEANCAKCHNSDGTGKQDPAWRTDEGYPIASRNFTANVFKGGHRSEDLFTRVSTGLAGTPMASFGSLPPDDIWRLVHYVQALADPSRPKPPSTMPVVAITTGRSN